MTSSLRIGIDLRYPDFAFMRGMGRYTLQTLHQVISQSPQHHYFFFCPKKTPKALKPFEQYPNVTFCRHFPSYTPTHFAQLKLLQDLIEKHLRYYIHHYQLDMYHIPILFHFSQPIPDCILPYPVLITVYDLIPYIYIEHFDYNDVAKSEYYRGIELIKNATRLVAISEATKQDVVRLLGYAEDKIQVVYPALDKHFGVLPVDVVNHRLNGLWERLGLVRPEHYILTVTDYFYTKNLETLIEAYAKLPKEVRDTYPLVITFDIQEKHLIGFNKQAEALGIADNLVFTRRVSEDDLVALYNGAFLMVYPSRYEGFGYPIAEAMACGAPVITTTQSSMPEVAGDAGILVSAEDAEAMSNAILQVCDNSELRVQMREKGLTQSAKFNLDNMAKAMLAAYHQFGKYTSDKKSAQLMLGSRALLNGVDLYVKVRWWVKHLVWRAYHQIYAPLKKRVLRPKN